MKKAEIRAKAFEVEKEILLWQTGHGAASEPMTPIIQAALTQAHNEAIEAAAVKAEHPDLLIPTADAIRRLRIAKEL